MYRNYRVMPFSGALLPCGLIAGLVLFCLSDAKSDETKPSAEASIKLNSPKIVKTGTYTLTVSGAIIRSTRVSQNDASVFYVKQCQACDYVSDEQAGSKYPKDGGSLVSDFACPKCGKWLWKFSGRRAKRCRAQ